MVPRNVLNARIMSSQMNMLLFVHKLLMYSFIDKICEIIVTQGYLDAIDEFHHNALNKQQNGRTQTDFRTKNIINRRKYTRCYKSISLFNLMIALYYALGMTYTLN